MPSPVAPSAVQPAGQMKMKDSTGILRLDALTFCQKLASTALLLANTGENDEQRVKCARGNKTEA